eukprot:scaffold2284_cov402-Prasinococcus_capsulatus_cf.AAC.4
MACGPCARLRERSPKLPGRPPACTYEHSSTGHPVRRAFWLGVVVHLHPYRHIAKPAHCSGAIPGAGMGSLASQAIAQHWASRLLGRATMQSTRLLPWRDWPTGSAPGRGSGGGGRRALLHRRGLSVPSCSPARPPGVPRRAAPPAPRQHLPRDRGRGAAAREGPDGQTI